MNVNFFKSCKLGEKLFISKSGRWKKDLNLDIEVSIYQFLNQPNWSAVSPVVVCVIPVVKMNQETVVHHIGDGCYADQRRIHAIHGLQLHPDVKPALNIHLKKAADRQSLQCSCWFTACEWTWLENNARDQCLVHQPAVKNVSTQH